MCLCQTVSYHNTYKYHQLFGVNNVLLLSLIVLNGSKRNGHACLTLVMCEENVCCWKFVVQLTRTMEKKYFRLNHVNCSPFLWVASTFRYKRCRQKLRYDDIWRNTLRIMGVSCSFDSKMGKIQVAPTLLRWEIEMISIYDQNISVTERNLFAFKKKITWTLLMQLTIITSSSTYKLYCLHNDSYAQFRGCSFFLLSYRQISNK